MVTIEQFEDVIQSLKVSTFDLGMGRRGVSLEGRYIDETGKRHHIVRTIPFTLGEGSHGEPIYFSVWEGGRDFNCFFGSTTV